MASLPEVVLGMLTEILKGCIQEITIHICSGKANKPAFSKGYWKHAPGR